MILSQDMNIIMSRAIPHQYHHRFPQPLTPTSPLDFTDNIPFNELVVDFNETLGSGSFGTVYKGRWRGRKVAIKQFRTREEIDSFLVEVKQLSCVKHPNIVTLYGSSTLTDNAYLIMEYAEGGSLSYLLHECKQQQQYDLRHACSWAMQTARGVAYLHGLKPKPIMHRDLKPANLLLFSRGKILKICDFGTACTVKTQMTNMTGSASYMAPEVFATSSYLESGDVYSWSIIFWEILARQQPYSSSKYSNPFSILFGVSQYGTRPCELENCPKVIWNLITKSWNMDPLRRPTMLEVAKEMDFIFYLTDTTPSLTKNLTPSTTTTTANNEELNSQSKNHNNLFVPICSSLKQDPQQSQPISSGGQQQQPQPPLMRTSQNSSIFSGTSSTTKKELYLHSRISLHRLELLRKRKEELESSSRILIRGEEDLLNEYQELKRQAKLKKEELKQRQAAPVDTLDDCRIVHPPTSTATATNQE